MVVGVHRVTDELDLHRGQCQRKGNVQPIRVLYVVCNSVGIGTPVYSHRETDVLNLALQQSINGVNVAVSEHISAAGGTISTHSAGVKHRHQSQQQEEKREGRTRRFLDHRNRNYINLNL